MDKLEQYLDQVCRCIGGPRPLRQHVRQELREHLLDAVAQHQAAGMSQEAALDKALEEFGKPEELRSEMEAAHGQRMMAVVIDKAMQWKERTMKAKWLWMSWAYVGLVGVIALEVLFITFNVIFIIPKFQKLLQDGMVDYAILEEHGATWLPAFLERLKTVAGGYTTHIILLSAAAWGLFEWRVHSENKPLMRLSALGTAAVGLMVVIVLMAGSMVISFTLAMPAMGRMARPFALEQVASIDTSVSALEQALAKKDWKAMQEPTTQAANALSRLSAGPAVTALTNWQQPPTVDELRATLKAAVENFHEVQQAIRAEDARRLETELQKFRKSLEPLREAAKRPPR